MADGVRNCWPCPRWHSPDQLDPIQPGIPASEAFPTWTFGAAPCERTLLLADTLQAAFDGYPGTDWAFQADERAERVAAVLDTSMRSNVELYAEMGLRTTAELRPAPGAPAVWVMVRKPRSPRSPA